MPLRALAQRVNCGTEKGSELHEPIQRRDQSANNRQSFFAAPIHAAGNLALQRLLRSGTLRAKLSVSQPGDIYEQEADRLADHVMAMSEPIVQRACAACESGAALCPSCEEETSLAQRKARAGEHAHEENPIGSSTGIIDGLGGGRPLDGATRNFFESRFGANFGDVRVHTGGGAAESARSLNALAYTLGRDLVFAPGQYAPDTTAGRQLLAHELTHVIQQSSPAFQPMLQRACIDDPECEPEEEGDLRGSAVKGSAMDFDRKIKRQEEEQAEKEERKTPEDIRKELCEKTPPDPKCTADGHARRATALEELYRALYPERSTLADGIFVDKDISKDVGAYVKKCAAFVPKLPGEECVFVPEYLEKQASRYNEGKKRIGGMGREAWLTDTLELLVHEFEHVRFRKAFPKTKPRPEACKFKDVRRELTELAAIMSQFPVFYRASARKGWHERRSDLDRWFTDIITQPSEHGETIAGIIKGIKCRCECQDVNAYIKRVVEFTTASWTEAEKNTFHTELRNPKWKLDWPIQTPPPPRDIPLLMVTPQLTLGYGSLGGLYLGGSLDIGIPVDRLGKWRLLLGAQARLFPGLNPDEANAYFLGLKFGFLRGAALGTEGLQYGAYGELGKGWVQSAGEKEKAGYAGGGLSLRYSTGLEKERSGIFFIGADIGLARLDLSKPELQKVFFAGLTFGAEF